jgi:prepilin-type processing-associated H-X9-DG protein
MSMLSTTCDEVLYIPDEPAPDPRTPCRTTCDDVLYIPDEPAPKRRAPGRWRAVFWVFATGIGASLAWAVCLGIDHAVRESWRSRCNVTLHRVGAAMSEYQEAHGHFPAPAIVGQDGTRLLSWRVAILPHLGYQSLYNRFHLDEPWDSPHNRTLLAEMPPEFACAAGPRRRAGKTGYLVIVGPETDAYSINTPFEATRGADIRHITDGTSNTILVLETDLLVPWTKPDDLQWSKDEPLPRIVSPHSGGAHALFADGGSRFLKSTIAPNTLVALLTINGNEILSAG